MKLENSACDTLAEGTGLLKPSMASYIGLTAGWTPPAAMCGQGDIVLDHSNNKGRDKGGGVERVDPNRDTVALPLLPSTAPRA